jgi:prepilin-type N-terminal cleavage/methylation domain-containing protein
MYQRLLTARKARRNEDGFTLIELLIVIVILGVLSAIVVFSVRGITDTGAEAACKANLAAADTAVEAWYANTGTNPANLAEVVPEFLKSDPSDDTAPGLVDPQIRVGYSIVAGVGTVTPGTACD